jgi:serine phosphatase RsbU (regulator of sigma subunit)
MKTCNTSFLLKNGLLFCNESDPGNRVEPSAHYFWAEGSDKGPSAQYLRPNIEPIYHQAIQHAFLPKDVPVLAGWQLMPYYQPAREVGGDFYDFLPFTDGRLGIVIGDATGKGMPAALVMATVHTVLLTAVQGMNAPGEILERVNNLLAAEIPTGMFVTCFFALLDPKSWRLFYANAGQDLPYRLHKDGISELWATGMPLGMIPGSRYEEQEVIVAPGDSLLFYSDGLVEAHNSKREMFDTPRLKALLEEHAKGASLIEVLLSELTRFTGKGWEQEDDVTLLTLERTPASLAMNEQQVSQYLLRDTTVANTPGNEQWNGWLKWCVHCTYLLIGLPTSKQPWPRRS